MLEIYVHVLLIITMVYYHMQALSNEFASSPMKNNINLHVIFVTFLNCLIEFEANAICH